VEFQLETQTDRLQGPTSLQQNLIREVQVITPTPRFYDICKDLKISHGRNWRVFKSCKISWKRQSKLYL